VETDDDPPITISGGGYQIVNHTYDDIKNKQL
jgi:hypothetical protein